MTETNFKEKWIQVDLMSVKKIDKIATQGIKRDNDGYTTSYSCQYKLNIDDEFKDVVDDDEEIVVSLERSHTSSYLFL